MQSEKRASFRTDNPEDFVRLFSELNPLVLSDDELRVLSDTMIESKNGLKKDSKVISNGLAIFSQFLAHDITFERGSNLNKNNSIKNFKNDRTINLDLDCIYGQKSQSFYYNKYDKDKLLLGQKYACGNLSWYDLQRNKNHIAIIPDARNDENIIVSRIHILFIQFHNKIVDYLRKRNDDENNSVFEEARKMTICYYHWLILHEYLFKIMDWTVFDRILKDGCQYYTDATSLPLEFTGAAFRTGHSQTRELNRINDITEKKLMELGFFERMEEYVDWRYLFNFGDGKCQFSKLIDTKVGSSFHKLPFLKKGDEASLPFLNLKRGIAYGLPSGEEIAKRMGFEPIEIRETKYLSGTPLWYYVLREAEILGHNGEHLGPIGSTILGECFYTVIKSDNFSFLNVNPLWRPTIGREIGKFNFVDMIQFVGC